MFFDSWHDLLRLLIVGTLAYMGLVLLLRVSGKRTLSKMNAFDFVVTVALGSTLSSVVLSNDVSLSEGLLAFALLCALQYIVAKASLKWRGFRALIKSEPRLLLFRGEFIRLALREERVSQDEVASAVRTAGGASLHDVEAVVLETDGSFSVVTSPGASNAALADVAGMPAAA